MKVLISALFLSLAHSAFGSSTTSFPTTDSPTIDETETSFPTTEIPETQPPSNPDDLVTTCVDLTLEFTFPNGNPVLFSEDVLGIIDSTVESSVAAQVTELVDNPDVSVTVENEIQDQNIVGDAVGVDCIMCIEVDGSPDDRRRLIEIELPSVAEIVEAVDETFDTPEKLDTFTEELKVAAVDAGVPEAFDDTEVTDTEVVKIPPSNPTAAPTVSIPCLDSTRDFLVNEVLQNCAWVAKEPSVRCLKGNGSAATHCQATCGKLWCL